MGAGSCPSHSTGVHSVLGDGHRGTGGYSALTLSSRQSLLGGYIPDYITRFPQNNLKNQAHKVKSTTFLRRKKMSLKTPCPI